MGRIKPMLVKRTTQKLLASSDEFNTEFDHNKKILTGTMPSKKIRNKIAGYIARIKQNEKNQKTPKIQTNVEITDLSTPTQPIDQYAEIEAHLKEKEETEGIDREDNPTDIDKEKAAEEQIEETAEETIIQETAPETKETENNKT